MVHSGHRLLSRSRTSFLTGAGRQLPFLLAVLRSDASILRLQNGAKSSTKQAYQ